MRFRLLLVPFVLLTSNISFAVELDITARFRPDALNPSNNSFENTTPNSGYCKSHPMLCNNMFSLLIPDLRTEVTPIAAGHTDRRQGAMISAPAEWKSLDITGPGGKSETVEIRISGIGARYQLAPSVRLITGVTSDLAGHGALWGGSWTYAAPPCQHTGISSFGISSFVFFWKAPSSGACGKTARFDIPQFSFSNINIMYELKTPNPLEMAKGIYTGQVNYTIGPYGDIDFGDILTPSDNTLTLNFALSVEHIMNVHFPPGSERLTLVPVGGWLQWLYRGRRPEKLYANQDFQVYSNSEFKMLLQCEHSVGNQCGIQNSAGHLVPVETRLTLPSGLLSESNTPVNRQPLSINPSTFYPTNYVTGNATLHFEVSQDSVREMTEHAGKQYTGDVTVIWDSEI